ncbi:MAG: cyclic pyranopterin monophosphate synthase MoaC [Clostridiales bacterium]|nr:cyclic pyranopterin monophosphate synthase MoaC [Clostridiales bacterium]
MEKLTHINEKGEANMVDISDKAVTKRRALASGKISMNAGAFDQIVSGTAPKGDVLGTARIAGITAAKRTFEMIPLCHLIMLSKVSIEFVPDPAEHVIECTCEVLSEGKTGVEMEALTGVSAALLTIYDMCKAADRKMTIGDIRLEEKDGGRSGSYRRKEN